MVVLPAETIKRSQTLNIELNSYTVFNYKLIFFSNFNRDRLKNTIRQNPLFPKSGECH
ncbi:hypothetical protein CLV62_15111 [Dysgonomonas alginatilytica]|uniref:Uncharacterized protein n=1 Tax=Dysgonomonas alginatilytica TaxID=1605892 RepID=A0A2V3PK70_9BACT|nr:hypothetical protein CLV62_15111 [Dysgonomonas alginatilytica]